MSRDAAQKTAVAAVRGLRYAGSEYFWIQAMAPRMVFHPKAELIGSDLAAVTEPSGKHLFADMVEVVKTSGGGFVPYLWTKPGLDQPVAKISYVQGFTPWAWIIGSGIDADDTAARLQPTLVRLLGGATIAAAVEQQGAATQVLSAASRLSRQSEHLTAEVARFPATVRAA